MKPSLADPNNHPPPITECDDWDDIAGFENREVSPLRPLPAKRTAASPTPAAENVSLKIGIAISPLPHPKSPTREISPPPSLQVHELSGQVVKLLQPEPSPEKLSAPYVFQPRPTPEAHVPEFDSADKQPPNPNKNRLPPWFWLGALGLTTLLILTAALAALPRVNRPNTQRASTSLPTLVPESQPDSADSIDVSDLLGRQDQASRIFELYAAAENYHQILPIVHNAEILESLLSDHWQPLSVPTSWKVPANAVWTVVKTPSGLIAKLKSNLPDFKPFSAYFNVENNQLKLDWKATTGFGTATFEELGQGTGNPMEIRGFLAPTNFFTRFWNEDQYQSYRLLCPKGEQAIWCYTQKNSDLSQKILNHFNSITNSNSEVKETKITLRLEPGNNDTLSNQWLIAELIQTDWNEP